MKIEGSDIHRFLQFAHKLWKSTFEGEPQTVVLTFTSSGYRIAMAKGAGWNRLFFGRFNLDDRVCNFDVW